MRLDEDISLPHNTPLLTHTHTHTHTCAQNSKQKIRMYEISNVSEQGEEQEVHM